MQDTRARELLTAELEQIETDARTERDNRGPSAGDEVMDGGDAGSQATESMDADLVLGMLDRRRQQLQAALVRLDHGTFGSCRVCGARVDDERLEIRPETESCRDHAEGDI